MKRIFTVLLAWIMMFTLCAFSKTDEKSARTTVTSGKPSQTILRKVSDKKDIVIVDRNDYFKLDAICVNDSYRVQRNNALRQVYLFFTVTAKDRNLEVDSKFMYLTINGVNKYQSYRILDGRNYFPNYSHSTYLEDIYIGQELKIFTTFEIPETDLTPGRTITLQDSEIPEINAITLSTDMIQYFDGQEEMAKAVDIEGYEKYVHSQEEADAAERRSVNDYIIGRTYWSRVNGIMYSVAFSSGNRCEVTMGPMVTDATYSIRNGYIFIHTVHKPEKPFMIPYTIDDNGVVDMEVYAMLGI